MVQIDLHTIRVWQDNKDCKNAICDRPLSTGLHRSSWSASVVANTLWEMLLVHDGC